MNTGYTLFKDTYVMYQLLEFIDESSIIALCKVSKKLTEICEQYIKLEDDKRFKISHNNIILEEYCKNKNVIKIRQIIKMNFRVYRTCRLYAACKSGHMDIIKLMIEKGADDWNSGLIGACEGGHIDIVKFMIEKGSSDWSAGLGYACWCGHIDIVRLMIEKDDGYYGCWNCNKSIEEHLRKK